MNYLSYLCVVFLSLGCVSNVYCNDEGNVTLEWVPFSPYIARVKRQKIETELENAGQENQGVNIKNSYFKKEIKEERVVSDEDIVKELHEFFSGALDQELLIEANSFAEKANKPVFDIYSMLKFGKECLDEEQACARKKQEACEEFKVNKPKVLDFAEMLYKPGVLSTEKITPEVASSLSTYAQFLEKTGFLSPHS